MFKFICLSCANCRVPMTDPLKKKKEEEAENRKICRNVMQHMCVSFIHMQVKTFITYVKVLLLVPVSCVNGVVILL